jgi:hypothetical protein
MPIDSPADVCSDRRLLTDYITRVGLGSGMVVPFLDPAPVSLDRDTVENTRRVAAQSLPRRNDRPAHRDGPDHVWDDRP